VSRESQSAYLAALGIDVYRLRDRPSSAATPCAAVSARESAPSLTDDDERWRVLEREVSTCMRCELCKGRTQTVFGVGRRDARLLVIGEAPGAEEDRQGEPFVGRAGILLNAMLRSIGLARGDVYIANILKCRPPGNRDPSPAETAECTPYLERQIELIAPRAALAVGRIAAQHLLQSDEPIGRLRGKLMSFGARRIPLVVTYHPAYLLRSPSAKSKSWQDLCLLRQLLKSGS
jgi:DNA polymerase